MSAEREAVELERGEQVGVVGPDVAEVEHLGGGRFEDLPVAQVVPVLGLVGEPVPSPDAALGLLEDVARHRLGEASGRGETDGGGVEVMEAVVDDAGGQGGAQLGERLMVADVGVAADEPASTDAAPVDPGGGDGAGGRRFVAPTVPAMASSSAMTSTSGRK